MGEDLYRLISTGLLAVIVLLLLLAVSQIGRLRRSLEDRTTTPAEPAPDGAAADRGSTSDTVEPAGRALEEPHADDAGVHDVAAVPSSAPESMAVAAVSTDGPTETVQPVEETEEGPYEQDGRWWFRRDGELLVYDEQLEQWVDANAPSSDEPAPAPEPVAEADPEPHPLDEAREWTTRQEDQTAQVPPVAETGTEPATASGITSAAPIPEPVNAPAPITEGEGSQNQGGSPGHWKCPSCGVINGSTASSCRMCFAARP